MPPDGAPRRRRGHYPPHTDTPAPKPPVPSNSSARHARLLSLRRPARFLRRPRAGGRRGPGRAWPAIFRTRTRRAPCRPADRRPKKDKAFFKTMRDLTITAISPPRSAPPKRWPTCRFPDASRATSPWPQPRKPGRSRVPRTPHSNTPTLQHSSLQPSAAPRPPPHAQSQHRRRPRTDLRRHRHRPRASPADGPPRNSRKRACACSCSNVAGNSNTLWAMKMR